MRPFLFSVLPVTDRLVGAMPPTSRDALSNGSPMSVLESWVLVGVLVLACWGSARLVIWLDIKLRTHVLLRELHRELGVGRDPGRSGSRRRRRA